MRIHSSLKLALLASSIAAILTLGGCGSTAKKDSGKDAAKPAAKASEPAAQVRTEKKEAVPAEAMKPAQEKASSSSSSEYHTVAKGDTLGKLAKKYGVSVKNLQSWNKVDSKKLKVGQKLRVSGK